MSLPLLTSSRLKAARACPRLHKLQYVDGYRSTYEAETLRFGTLFHAALEAWWRAPRTVDELGAFGSTDPKEWLSAAIAALNVAEADPFDRARARVLIAGYHMRWAQEDLEVLGVEVEFSCPLVNPLTGAASKTWQLGGKLDLVVRDRRSGLVLVGEHKTSSEDITQGSEYWRRLRMDGQVSVYFEGGRALGHDVAGCLYDVIGKPGLRPGSVPLLDDQGVKIVHDQAGQRVRTKDGKKWRESASTADGYVLQTRPETPEEYEARLLDAVSKEPDRYFQRGTVSRLDGEMADAITDVWQLAQQLREAERLGRAPRNPDSCARYGRTCEFFDVCSGTASLEDAARFTRDSNVHPELSSVAGRSDVA